MRNCKGLQYRALLQIQRNLEGDRPVNWCGANSMRANYVETCIFINLIHCFHTTKS
jgi:hypothetical protein